MSAGVISKPTCAVRGRIQPGAMCGSIIVGLKYCGFGGACQHKVDAPDAIAMIVDRDTPPDNRNEIIDHDIVGNPITRGMVDAFNKGQP